MAKKLPNPIDKHVGSRVRMRQMMLGMSQEKLGDALELSFQQMQKYERGTNRMGSSRLQQMPTPCKFRLHSSLKVRPVNPSWTAVRRRRPMCQISSQRQTGSCSRKHSCKSRTPSYGVAS